MTSRIVCGKSASADNGHAIVSCGALAGGPAPGSAPPLGRAVGPRGRRTGVLARRAAPSGRAAQPDHVFRAGEILLRNPCVGPRESPAHWRELRLRHPDGRDESRRVAPARGICGPACLAPLARRAKAARRGRRDWTFRKLRALRAVRPILAGLPMRHHLPWPAPAVAERFAPVAARAFRLPILRASFRWAPLARLYEQAGRSARPALRPARRQQRLAAALPGARLLHFLCAGRFCVALPLRFECRDLL